MIAQSENAGPAAATAPIGVAGVGMTRFASTDDRSLLELLETASETAIEDADLDRSTIDTVIVGNMAAEAFNRRSGLANALVASIGINGADARRIENTSASGASAFLTGVDAIRAGRASTVLVVGGEKMSSADVATSTDIISRITHHAEYEHGITLPSFAGLAADRYLREHDIDREELARVPVKSHKNASENPYAQFNNRITVEEALSSPRISTPLRLYDCCPTSDGAAAVVLTAGEEAVTVAGCEGASGVHAVADRPNPLRIESVRRAGRSVYDAADIEPDDIDVACIHDAFSILEWLEMEELGLADHGEAWTLTRDGETDLDGALPVNPGGGLKARGHPLGATGISQIIELVWQLCGELPSNRAVPDPEYGLAINVAGFGNNSICSILEATV